MTPSDSAVPFVLSFASASSLTRRGEPIVCGVPLPRGLMMDVGLRVDASHAARQTDVLDRWPDGSARWALVSLRVDQDDATPSAVALAVAPPSSASSRRSLIRRDGTRLFVDTGRLQLTLGSGSRWPVLGATIDGREVCDTAHSGLTLTAAGGAEIPVSVDRVWVEREGPSHALIRASGQHMDAGRALAYVEWQITVHADLPVMQMAVTLRNPRKAEHPSGHWELGDSGSLLLEDVTFSLHVPAGERVSAAACSVDVGGGLAGVALPFALYQESSGGERWNGTNHVNREGRVPQNVRGYRRSDGLTGLRATPLLQVQTTAGTITLATRHFWQNCPKQLTADAEGISYSLWPRAYPDAHEVQGGEQRTHVFALAFGDDGVTDIPLDWWRSPLLPIVDPAWTASTGAIAHLLPEACDPHAAYIALVRQAIEGSDTFTHKREWLDEYGWRHFGDIYGDHEAVRHQGADPLVSHYNNQYDPVFGFALQFLRSGDARWWPQCDELASHVVDVDIYHTTEDKAAYNNGLFWHTVHYIDAGKATHRTYPKAPGSHGGGPASEQNYTTGLMTHWFLTGNPLSRETAIGLGQFVIDIDDGTKTPFKWLDGGHTGLATASASEFYHGPGRGSGNSLNALIDAHRLSGDERFIEKADQIIRRAVHPEQDITALNLPDIERKWFYTMFLQSLGKYLDYRAELGRLDAAYAYARETLLHFARWMAEHEYPYLEKPEVLEFPTETWPAQDMRKSEVFKYAALHASGSERDRFLERADFFFRYSVDTLTADRRKSLARPVILLLAYGWRHAWAMTHRDAAAQAPSVTPAAWPPHEVFVPQKARAIKRAKMIAGTIAAATVLGAAALLATIVW